MKKINILIGLILSSLAWGGEDRGNGGDVYICPLAQKNMILDYHEGIQKGLFKHFGSPSKSVKYNLDLWLNNLSHAGDYYIDQFRERAYLIADEIEALQKNPDAITSVVGFTDQILQDVPDSFELINPRGCEKHQIAVQTNARLGYKKFVFNSNLLKQITNNQIAILITHELIYEWFKQMKDERKVKDEETRIAKERAAIDSTYVRYFNQLVAANAFKGINVCEFYRKIDEFERDITRFVFSKKDSPVLYYIFPKESKAPSDCSLSKVNRDITIHLIQPNTNIHTLRYGVFIFSGRIENVPLLNLNHAKFENIFKGITEANNYNTFHHYALVRHEDINRMLISNHLPDSKKEYYVNGLYNKPSYPNSVLFYDNQTKTHIIKNILISRELRNYISADADLVDIYIDQHSNVDIKWIRRIKNFNRNSNH